MDKLVGASVMVLIVVSIWLVIPSDPPSVVRDKAQGQGSLAVAADLDKSSAGVRPVSKAKSGRVEPSAAMDTRGTGAPPRTAQTSREASQKNTAPDIVDGEPVNARVFAENPVERAAKTETKSDEPAPGPYADVHWDGETDYADLEGALMKLYSARDSDGRLPKNIVASQVLRESVLNDLKVSASTPVVMIGDYHPVHQDAVTETLKRARKGQFLTGFTFADPTSTSDGRRVYIKVLLD